MIGSEGVRIGVDVTGCREWQSRMSVYTCGGESGWAMSLSELVLMLSTSMEVLWPLSTRLAARDKTSSGDSGIPSQLAITITCK